MKTDFTKYTLTQKYGMESIGDTEFEYLTKDEIKEVFDRKSAYVEECKRNGSYGQEYTQTIEIQNDCIFDKPNTSTESYKVVILDFSDGKE